MAKPQGDLCLPVLNCGPRWEGNPPTNLATPADRPPPPPVLNSLTEEAETTVWHCTFSEVATFLPEIRKLKRITLFGTCHNMGEILNSRLCY